MDVEATKDIVKFVDFALDKWTILLSVGLYLFLAYVSRAIELTKRPVFIQLWRRLLPLIPELIAVPGALIGGIPAVANQPIAYQIATGLWVAYLSSKTRKLLGQTILGDDAGIERALLRKSNPEDVVPTEPDNKRGG